MPAALIALLRRRYAPPAPDAELLRAYAEGRDQDAFRRLVERHGPLVLGACRRLLGDPGAADDAFQATFLTLARRAGAVRRPEAPAGWLSGVARHVCRNARKTRDRRRAAEAHAIPRPAADPAAEVSARELMGALDDELDRLPERWRLPLALVHWQGLTHAEAARRLGLTPAALHGRLDRGRARLAQRLTRRRFAPGDLRALLAAPLAAAAVPRDLLAATAALAAEPWSKAIPAAVIALVTTQMSAKLMPAAVACVLLAGAGLFALAGGAPWRERGINDQADRPLTAQTPAPPQAPAPRVDAEGVPLPPGALVRLGSTRMRHDGEALPFAFAPDGRSIAARGADAVHIWDVATGKALRTIDLRTVRELHYAADGRELFVVTDGADLELRSIDVATGRELRTVTLAKGGLRYGPRYGLRYGVVFSPSGRRLAVSTSVDDKKTRLFDTATGRETWAIPLPDASVSGLSFSRDEQTLAAPCRDTLRLYHTATGAVTAEWKRANTLFRYTAFSPNGRLLAVLAHSDPGASREVPDANRVVELWDVATGTILHKLSGGRTVAPISEAFSPDNRIVAVCSSTYALVLFDAATGKLIRELPCSSLILKVAFTPDGRVLAVASLNGTISLYDVESGRRLPASADPPLGVHNLRYVDSGRKLLGVSDRVIAWDPATGRELHRSADLSSVETDHRPVLSPDQRLIALRAKGGDIWLGEAETGRELRRLAPPGTEFLHPQCVFAPDGRRLIASDNKGVIVVWDTTDGVRLAEMDSQTDGWIRLDVSPDGRWLVSTSTVNNASRLWDLTTYQEVRRFTPPPGSTVSRAFSADSRLLATAGSVQGRRDGTGTVQVWEVATGRELRKVVGDAGCVTFSADGRTLATGGLTDGTVRLWEVATGGERHRITGHARRVSDVVFAPDGRTLAAASLEAPVYIWDAFGNLEQPAGLPTAAELGEAWEALAGADAKAAFQALRRLVAAPAVAVPFVRERLKPVAAVEAARVRELVRQLDSSFFTERQRAVAELRALADRFAVELRAALAAADVPEVRQALEEILSRAAPDTPEALRAIRAVEALERIATAAAREYLKSLAEGAPGAILTDAAAAALRRLTGPPA